jgi:hypothetical protein
MYKYEEQFRVENPQTIGETDQQFDLSNYKDWLERKLEDATKKLIENNEDMDLETLLEINIMNSICLCLVKSQNK